MSNLISIKAAGVEPRMIESLIQDALSRHLLREAKRVEVIVNGAAVTLKGHVNSWQERNAIQGAAWACPGVAAVINELVIAP